MGTNCSCAVDNVGMDEDSVMTPIFKREWRNRLSAVKPQYEETVATTTIATAAADPEIHHEVRSNADMMMGGGTTAPLPILSGTTAQVIDPSVFEGLINDGALMGDRSGVALCVNTHSHDLLDTGAQLQRSLEYQQSHQVVSNTSMASLQTIGEDDATNPLSLPNVTSHLRGGGGGERRKPSRDGSYGDDAHDIPADLQSLVSGGEQRNENSDSDRGERTYDTHDDNEHSTPQNRVTRRCTPRKTSSLHNHHRPRQSRPASHGEMTMVQFQVLAADPGGSADPQINGSVPERRHLDNTPRVDDDAIVSSSVSELCTAEISYQRWIASFV